MDSQIDIDVAIRNVGGLAGNVKNSIIRNCHTTGKIALLVRRASISVGGLIGISNDSLIENCKNTGLVMVTNQGLYREVCIGGIVARDNWGSNIANCYNTGTLTVMLQPARLSPQPDIYIGGIGGWMSSSDVDNCYNNGEITVKDTTTDDIGYTIKAGGICGELSPSSNDISSCYNTGNVKILSKNSRSRVGGITGYCPKIENCYNTGEIKSDTNNSSYIGGIVGYSIRIKSCYNIGIVETEASQSCIGGIAGLAPGVSNNNNYYLNSIANGIGTGEDNAVPCTLEEMQDAETFIGFDFNSIWTINICKGYLYPQLQNNRQTSNGHDFTDWQVRTLASCTEPGEEFRACACGEEETRSIDPLGHSFTNYVYDNNAACTTDGTETAKCDRCDATDTRTAAGTATGHTFSGWQVRTPASCTEKGEEYRACACGEEETRSIDPLGHTLVKTEAVEPTETSAGNIEYWTCTVCGKLFSDEAANNEITQAETVLPKLEHTHVYGSYAYDGNAHWQTCACGQTSERTPHAFGAWTVTKEPTYTEEGIRSRTCVCGFTETETLPCAVLLGDVNLDGKVTPTDYLLLKRQLVVEDCLTEAGKQRADINGDGALTPTDYLLLKRMILGL